jgi:hypothetical protein
MRIKTLVTTLIAITSLSAIAMSAATAGNLQVSQKPPLTKTTQTVQNLTRFHLDMGSLPALK